MTRDRSCFKIALATIALLIPASSAHAQLAPTGTHYAGRSSDTGHSVVGSSGGYAASVPLDLPAARGRYRDTHHARIRHAWTRCGWARLGHPALVRAT